MLKVQARSVLAVFILTLVGGISSALANDAGCGLGSLIMKDNTVVSQTLAMTTNATLSSQFFGITSGTSNCSTNGFVMRQKEAEMFAEANLQHLKVEMARGQGDNLKAFAEILGCNKAAIAPFSAMTQSRYSQIFPTATVLPHQMIESVKKEISSDASLKVGCSAAI